MWNHFYWDYFIHHCHPHDRKRSPKWLWNRVKLRMDRTRNKWISRTKWFPPLTIYFSSLTNSFITNRSILRTISIINIVRFQYSYVLVQQMSQFNATGTWSQPTSVSSHHWHHSARLISRTDMSKSIRQNFQIFKIHPRSHSMTEYFTNFMNSLRQILDCSKIFQLRGLWRNSFSIFLGWTWYFFSISSDKPNFSCTILCVIFFFFLFLFTQYTNICHKSRRSSWRAMEKCNEGHEITGIPVFTSYQ